VIWDWLLVAAVAHLVEEYVYPGGFLRWIHSWVGFAPNAVEAITLNLAFLGLVAAPLFGASLLLTVSVPSLLITNGVMHVVGTIASKRYSPGVITSVLLFFPLATYALLKMPTVSSDGILLGIGWMLVPLTVVGLRRLVTQR
jgi:Protein of unknown function with HXXEE motif